MAFKLAPYTPKCHAISMINELQEMYGSDGILELMVDKAGSACLLDEFFEALDEESVIKWFKWLNEN
tara:strand:+ start:118 stop:318 length:201 start_codon:yes stop_codon:yes gene_type:complete